jgi:hypothetical protein
MDVKIIELVKDYSKVRALEYVRRFDHSHDQK